MKTALLLSGHLRCFRDCYESLKRNILDVTNCDIFMHLYASDDAEDALHLYKPKKYIISDPSESVSYSVDPVCRMYKAPETDVDGVFSMWNNINKAFSLVDPYYDCVIKGRYDIKFSAPLKLNLLNMNDINIPEGGDWRGGMFDMLALSSYENMRYYCSMIDCLNRYTRDERILFHPEIVLRHHLRDCSTYRFPFPVYLRKKYEKGVLEDKIFTVLNP